MPSRVRTGHQTADIPSQHGRQSASPTRRRIGLIVLIAGLVVLQPDRAMAYIDPATGSYFFQWLLAALLAAAFGLKIFWRNVTAFFGRMFSGNRATTKEPEEDQES